MASAFDAESWPPHPMEIQINEPGLIGTLRTHVRITAIRGPTRLPCLSEIARSHLA